MDSQPLSLQLQCPPLESAASYRLDDGKSNALASTSSPSPSPAPSEHSDVESFDTIKEPSSGPQRSKSSPSAKGSKEKRKRSRVNPEQLIHLERFFLADRSPTAIRRKEISEMLGMQERQTQIWFQNRRAKAKLQDGRPRLNDNDVSPLNMSHLGSDRPFGIQALIHEDEPVTIISCTDLSIGSWRRVASTSDSHDLITYVCEARQCLTWFIHSVGYGFKMEIDFDTIADTEFNGTTMGSGMVAFTLSQPPLFFVESTTPLPDGSVQRYWKQCADWTEGHQASHVLRHELIGSAPHLANLVNRLRPWAAGGQLSNSPFTTSTFSTPSTPNDSLYSSSDLVVHRRASDMDHPGFNSNLFHPSRSSYAKGIMKPSFPLQAAPRLRSAPPPTLPPSPITSQFSSTPPSLFSDGSGYEGPQDSLNMAEFRRASAPLPYGSSRSYMTQSLAQPIPLSVYNQPRSLSQFSSLRQSMSFGDNSSPSLPIPFPTRSDFGSTGQTQPMLTGLVGYPYETDERFPPQGNFLGLKEFTPKKS